MRLIDLGLALDPDRKAGKYYPSGAGFLSALCAGHVTDRLFPHRAVAAFVALVWEHVRELRLIHPVHELADFFGAHGRANEHAELQRGTHE